MITGIVQENGIPVIEIEFGGDTWKGIIDTGFNGDLELPEQIRPLVNAELVGRSRAFLAGNQVIDEDLYVVDFQFDGRACQVEATFVDSTEVLIGTGMLLEHT